MASTRGGRRGGPAFKPPTKVQPVSAARSVNDSTPTGPTSGRSRLGRAGRADTSARSRSGPSRVQAIDLSSSESEDTTESEMAPQDAQREASGESDVEMPEAEVNDEEPAVPLKLLARLLYDGIEDKGMKISREAMAVYDRYMDTFVRETVARAAFEREDAKVDGISDAFLQVEDLEKLAPQLLLDF